MRLIHCKPLVAVLVAVALSVPHTQAHDATDPSFGRASDDPRGGGVAPAPVPLGYGPASERDARDGADAVLITRDMFELVKRCHERGCALTPEGGGQYVVTTGTSVADEGREKHSRESEQMLMMPPLPPQRAARPL